MTLFEILLCVFTYILMGIWVKEMWELCTDPYEWRDSIWIGAFWPVTVPIILLLLLITIVIVLIEMLVELFRWIFKKKSTDMKSADDCDSDDDS